MIRRIFSPQAVHASTNLSDSPVRDERLNRRGFLKLGGVGAAGGLLTQASVAKAAPLDVPRGQHAFNVMDFGAAGDGKTNDTNAINDAIAAASGKGGTLYFPGGVYLAYTIHLKSDVTLDLLPGCIIMADEPSPAGGFDQPESNALWEPYQDFGHNHWRNSLFCGDGLKNVSIVGSGLLWGKSLSRGEGEGPVAETPGVGNKTIALRNCHNVLLRDFSILHGGHFGILATSVDNLTIDNLKIDTNRDGIDVDCCRNVRISNCSVNTPMDDGIVLKSSYALGHLKATEAVSIVNCYVTGGFEEGSLLNGTFRKLRTESKAGRVGRIKIGTESNGDFLNIAISNCIFESCHGLAIESVDGARIEDVVVTNISMRNIFAAPVFLRLGARLRGPGNPIVGSIKRVRISNLVSSHASARYASILSGVPNHPIEDVSLSGIFIHHLGGITAVPPSPPELPEQYPEPEMFGSIPAQCIYVRHVNRLNATDVTVASEAHDARPMFVLQDVADANFIQIHTDAIAESPTFSLTDVKRLRVALATKVPDMFLDETPSKSL